METKKRIISVCSSFQPPTSNLQPSKSEIRELTAYIVSQEVVGREYREMILKVPDLKDVSPGQFVNLKVTSAGFDPLLRRPFSVHYWESAEKELHLLYRITGRGTEILSRLPVGERMSLLAPLGHGFSLEGLTPETPVLLVAGGIGFAPLYFLACCLQEKKIPYEVFLGGRSREDITGVEKINKLAGYPPRITTEDGSLGEKGLVTAALSKYLDSCYAHISSYRLFACGPNSMLEAVADIAASQGNLPLQFSMESIMACGIGVCLGCVCRPIGENAYKKVCSDGPVFSTSNK